MVVARRCVFGMCVLCSEHASVRVHACVVHVCMVTPRCVVVPVPCPWCAYLAWMVGGLVNWLDVCVGWVVCVFDCRHDCLMGCLIGWRKGWVAV